LQVNVSQLFRRLLGYNDTVQSIQRLVYRGELPIVKVAGSTSYDVEDFDDYIEIIRCRKSHANGLTSVTLRDLIERKGRAAEGT
jgi:hypothetical protein